MLYQQIYSGSFVNILYPVRVILTTLITSSHGSVVVTSSSHGNVRTGGAKQVSVCEESRKLEQTRLSHILVHRSPTGKHQSPTLKAPRKPQSPTPKGSRKRKRHRTEQENSTETDICPTADPLCGCHGDEPKLTPKRRRLSHSEYSITVEEDPLCGEHAGSAKVVISLAF